MVRRKEKTTIISGQENNRDGMERCALTSIEL